MLLEAALAADLAGQDLGEADHTLLTEFAETLLAKLVEALDQRLHGAPDSAAPKRTFALMLDGEMAGTIAFDEGRLVSCIKEGVGAHRPAEGRFQTRRAAIKDISVAVEAVLGQAEVTLDEIKALSPDDILRLDTIFGKTIPVRVVGQSRAFAHGKLVNIDGNNGVELV